MRHRRGFTVQEVLIVLGIVVVLAGLISMVLNSSVSKAKTEPVCAQNLKQIAVALNLYVADYDGGFPIHNLVGDGGALGLSTNCPLQAVGYDDAYGAAIAQAKWAQSIGLKPTLEDPAGRSIPEFDATKDVLVRCLGHAYDGFNAVIGRSWNRSATESKGRLLSVRYDTSVGKAPVVSCWELRYHSQKVIPSLTSWKDCDRP